MWMALPLGTEQAIINVKASLSPFFYGKRIAESPAVILEHLYLFWLKIDESYNSLAQRISVLSFEEQAHLEGFYQFPQLAIVAGNDRSSEVTCVPDLPPGRP